MWAALGCAATGFPSTQAAAEALLVIEAESGKVLYAENATYPWYPASVTKVMTAYAVLRAVKDGRLTLESSLTVSRTAAAQAPVKMGFPPGTVVTVDNALKMMMVRSSNDIAVVLAEGVGGSIENFSDIMNAHARRLGMTQSSFVNPNGLPADDQITSARDMAILARALIREFPEYDYYWHIPAIKMGRAVHRNYNALIGRYPGADGMKTGFICASGFNLVASASRDGKRLIAVVMGAPSSQSRAMKAAQLMERGFNSGSGLAWLMPSMGTVDALQPVNAAPPNLRDEMCGSHRKRQATEDEDEVASANVSADSPYAAFLSSLRPKAKGESLLQNHVMGEPSLVYIGPYRKPGTVVAEPKPRTRTAAKPKPSSQGASQAASQAASQGTQPASDEAKPKATPKTAAKPSASRAGKSSGSKSADGTGAAATSDAPKPKPKKPAPKNPQTTSQAVQPTQTAPTLTTQTR